MSSDPVPHQSLPARERVASPPERSRTDARDNNDNATKEPRESSARRQTLGALGRVTSRVRISTYRARRDTTNASTASATPSAPPGDQQPTPNPNNAAAAAPAPRRSKLFRRDDDGDSSPWGAGTAAAAVASCSTSPVIAAAVSPTMTSPQAYPTDQHAVNNDPAQKAAVSASASDVTTSPSSSQMHSSERCVSDSSPRLPYRPRTRITPFRPATQPLPPVTSAAASASGSMPPASPPRLVESGGKSRDNHQTGGTDGHAAATAAAAEKNGTANMLPKQKKNFLQGPALVIASHVVPALRGSPPRTGRSALRSTSDDIRAIESGSGEIGGSGSGSSSGGDGGGDGDGGGGGRLVRANGSGAATFSGSPSARADGTPGWGAKRAGRASRAVTLTPAGKEAGVANANAGRIRGGNSHSNREWSSNRAASASESGDGGEETSSGGVGDRGRFSLFGGLRRARTRDVAGTATSATGGGGGGGGGGTGEYGGLAGEVGRRRSNALVGGGGARGGWLSMILRDGINGGTVDDGGGGVMGKKGKDGKLGMGPRMYSAVVREAEVRMTGERSRSRERKHLSDMDFGDDELYNSEEDELHDQKSVESYAHDDFVDFQVGRRR